MPSGPDDLLERLMHRDVVSADPGATLRELAEIMYGEEVGSVVITEAGRVTGIVTQRDIVVALANGEDPDGGCAADIMSEEPMCADVADSVRFTAERLAQAGVLHVPVLEDGRPVGMVSGRDLLMGPRRSIVIARAR
jgi:CBS domain-containing protein